MNPLDLSLILILYHRPSWFYVLPPGMGYGMGDFITISTPVLSLYKAFKSASEEFKEINRELQSFRLVVADLMEKAGDEESL